MIDADADPRNFFWYDNFHDKIQQSHTVLLPVE